MFAPCGVSRSLRFGIGRIKAHRTVDDLRHHLSAEVQASAGISDTARGNRRFFSEGFFATSTALGRLRKANREQHGLLAFRQIAALKVGVRNIGVGVSLLIERDGVRRDARALACLDAVAAIDHGSGSNLLRGYTRIM
jgi:hypothetical protein